MVKINKNNKKGMIYLKKKLRVFIILFILTIFYLYVANITLMPKSITLLQGEKIELAKLFGVNLVQKNKIELDDDSKTLQTSSNISESKISDTREDRYGCKPFWNY